MASRSAKQTRYAPQPMVTSAPKPAPRNPIAGAVRNVIANRKPAMQASVGQRIAQQVTDRNGNRLGPRATVGPADPATRRAALDAALKPGPAVKTSAPKTPPAQQYEGGGVGNRARRKVIDSTVDRMSR